MTLLRGSIALLFLALFWLGCGMGVPPGSPETGYAIHGFIGRSHVEAAQMVLVTLLDGKSGGILDTATTDFMGRYVFSGLEPGPYAIGVGAIKKDLILGQQNVRLDLDLSAKDGLMDYTKTAMADMKKKKAKGKKTGGKAGGDAKLAQQFAGKYWGYSGVSGGGTERNWAFCPDGSYFESSESSYSGSESNQYGEETMNWGSVGQNSGDGTWSVNGNSQSGTITIEHGNGKTYNVQYQAIDNQGCYKFDGTQLCRTGPCK